MPFKEYSKPSFEKLTLLCVDDSPTIQLMYKNFFETTFKEVVFAEDGLKGLELSQNVDIIITDYNMPNMNGLTMMSHIRKLDENIPLILVTSFEDIEILKEAIQLGASSFVQKPFEKEELFIAVNRAVEQVIGHRLLLEKQQNQIHVLEKKEKYSNYQEDLSFKKELSMIRNDFYYRLSKQDSSEDFSLCDFFYKPLDTTSGDLYSARQLMQSKELYFLVDGMGKGLSASVSAVLFTSHVNYIIDEILKRDDDYDFEHLVNLATEYMRTRLLEEEVLAVTLVCIDTKEKTLKYASFGMPAILCLDQDNELLSLSSNNPPLSQYTYRSNVNELCLNNVVKILITSDGIPENSVKDTDKTYAEFIKEDFKASMTRDDFKERLESKIAVQEDDMTFILLHKISKKESLVKTTIPAQLQHVEELGSWYEGEVHKLSEDVGAIIKASLCFTELIMNAYEHGSLGIDNQQKHQLMQDDAYFDFLNTRELEERKHITVTLRSVTNTLGELYLITEIQDEGEGFDTKIFSRIFGIHKNFNGRGAFIAKQSSLGIYYNNKGNGVYFINKL
jgi:CheY-like chemotaxis protein